LKVTYSVTVRSDLDGGTESGGVVSRNLFGVGTAIGVSHLLLVLLVLVVVDVLVVVLILFNRRTLFLVLLILLVLGVVADRSDGVGNGSVSLHLLRGNKVPGDEHPEVVPDLHHLLVRSSSESESVVTTAEQTSTAGGLAVSGSTVLSGLDVELVRLGSSSRRRRTKSAGRQEERPDGVGGSGWVGRGVLVQVTGRGEDVESFLVGLGESLLSLEETRVDGGDGRVVLAGVVNVVGASERSLGVEQVVRSSSERDPFSVGHELRHVDTELSPSVLDRGRHSRLPLVEGGPGGLDGSNDALLEVSRVLLHDDDGLLERVLLGDLLLELLQDGHVDGEGVLLGANGHGGVVDVSDSSVEVRDDLGRHLSLLGDGSSQLSSVVLDVLDVGLDLGPELLQVLDNGRLDSPGKRRVRVGNDPGLVSDGVEDILHTALTEELVSGSEGNLNDGTELGELLGSVGLDVGNALEVGWELVDVSLFYLVPHTDEHLDDLLPSGESLNEDIGRLELMAASVLLAVDQRSPTKRNRYHPPRTGWGPAM
jgi:hypothetical protein